MREPSTNWATEHARAVRDIRGGGGGGVGAGGEAGERYDCDSGGKGDTGPAEGKDEMLAQGDMGVGVGAPGSRKEKKLWDKECLWWCPLRDTPPVDVVTGLGMSGAFEGRPPNEKPGTS
jgi:hypothetical protein